MKRLSLSRSAPHRPVSISAVILLGLYQALLGIAVLLTPHWFSAALYRVWSGYEIGVGLAFLLGGAGLLWAVILPIQQRAVLSALYTLAVLNFGEMAVLFARAGATHGGVVYGVLALGTMLLGVRQIWPPTRPVAQLADVRPLAVIIHLIALLTGALMLLRPDQYAGPLYAPMYPWLPVFGTAFTLLGAVLLARDLLFPTRWVRTASLVDLVFAALLVWWGVGFVTTRVWTGVLTYALLTLGVIDAALFAGVPGWDTLSRSLGNPLRRRVALSLATVLVTTAVVLTLVLTGNNAGQAREDATDDTVALASSVAERLTFYLDTHLAVVAQVAALPSLEVMDLGRTENALRDTKVAFPGFDNLSLVDPLGQQIVRATEGKFVNLGPKPYIQRALSGEPRVFGGITISVSTGDPIVVMAAPVRSPATDAVIGAVSASIQLPVISEFLTGTSAAQGRDIIVVDPDGLVVASSDPKQVSAGSSLAGSPVLAAVQARQPGSATYVRDGQRVLAGHAPVLPYDWDVIIEQPEAAALAAVWDIEEHAYLLALMASVLLTALAVVLVDRLFRPVAALIEPLRLLGQGRYEVALPAGTEGEVGDLVRVVERMRGDLRDREAALAASEARFRSLIENGSDIVIVLDEEGVVRMVTPTIEHALGHTPAALVGRQQFGPLHPDDEMRAAEVFAEVREEPGGERRSEVRLRHRDGGWRSFEAVIQNRLGDPSVRGIVASLRDVTEQRQLQEERDRLYAELDAEFQRAAEVQAQMLPHSAPEVAGYEFAGVCEPARQVGGDFFDWTVEDALVRLSLGDVMGKGMAAALQTATVRAALRTVTHLSVAGVVETVNRALSPDLIQLDHFITLFHANLDTTTGVLTYIDAGHGMAFVQRQNGTVELLRQHALPLGILIDAEYPAGTTTLEPGDTLVIYSDGLPDARPELELDAVKIGAQISELKDVQAKLERLVSLVSDIQTRPDDLTLVLLRREEDVVMGEPIAVTREDGA